jgi:hypothetical protein
MFLAIMATDHESPSSPYPWERNGSLDRKIANAKSHNLNESVLKKRSNVYRWLRVYYTD